MDPYYNNYITVLSVISIIELTFLNDSHHERLVAIENELVMSHRKRDKTSRVMVYQKNTFSITQNLSSYSLFISLKSVILASITSKL